MARYHPCPDCSRPCTGSRCRRCSLRSTARAGSEARWKDHRIAAEQGMKPCLSCNETKPLSAFHKQTTGSSGANPYCKECRRKFYGRKYGFDLKDYNKMLAAQDGRCAICKKPPTPRHPLCIDHCHATNQIRGLICRPCNSALGHAFENPEILRRMIQYLKKAQTPAVSDITFFSALE